MKKRIDLSLVELNLSPSRSRSYDLIKQGLVLINGIAAKAPGQLVSEADKIEVKVDYLYVGRGGQKLEDAVAKLSFAVRDKIFLDVGASTGGFTEVLLKNGAIKVYAVDVGEGQLAEKLKMNPQVINLEKTDIRQLELPELVDAAVIDVSFISIKQIISQVFLLCKRNAQVMALIKPQFEVGKGQTKKGVVKDKKILLQTLIDLVQFFNNLSINVISVHESSILGKEGNKEFFFLLEKEKLDKQNAGLFDLINKLVNGVV